jgi:hypothetical protein
MPGANLGQCLNIITASTQVKPLECACYLGENLVNFAPLRDMSAMRPLPLSVFRGWFSQLVWQREEHNFSRA